MRLRVRHVTRFAYDAPVVDAHTELRLKPAHVSAQTCARFSIRTEPAIDDPEAHVDRFGNTVHHLDLLDPHDVLEVIVESEVWTPETYVDERPPSRLENWDFLQETRYVPVDGSIEEIGKDVAGDAQAVASTLMQRVRDAMTYERGWTNVHTRADEALRDGRGVCQDFAHVLIGACRSRGIPARYVSGYLYDPKSAAEGASHAWVDVYDDTRGWLSLDPTHDTEQTERYIRIGVGRDYADVPPTRGVFKGKAEERLHVSVSIEALEEEA